MIAKNLKRIMKEKGVTGAALAKETGFSKASVSQYINGINTPSRRRLEMIAAVLGVNVGELTEEAETCKTETHITSVIPAGITTLSVKQAAGLLHKNENFVRQGLRERLPGFEFGTAVKVSSKWSYCIYANKFTEITGIPINGA